MFTFNLVGFTVYKGGAFFLMIDFIAEKEDARNIHPLDEVFSTPGLNIEPSQLNKKLDTLVESICKDKEPDATDENVKDKDIVDMGEESSVNSDKEKEHPKEKSPSLLQAMKILKRGRKRKIKGCFHSYKHSIVFSVLV